MLMPSPATDSTEYSLPKGSVDAWLHDTGEKVSEGDKEIHRLYGELDYGIYASHEIIVATLMDRIEKGDNLDEIWEELKSEIEEIATDAICPIEEDIHFTLNALEKTGENFSMVEFVRLRTHAETAVHEVLWRAYTQFSDLYTEVYNENETLQREIRDTYVNNLNRYALSKKAKETIPSYERNGITEELTVLALLTFYNTPSSAAFMSPLLNDHFNKVDVIHYQATTQDGVRHITTTNIQVKSHTPDGGLNLPDDHVVIDGEDTHNVKRYPKLDGVGSKFVRNNHAAENLYLALLSPTDRTPQQSWEKPSAYLRRMSSPQGCIDNADRIIQIILRTNKNARFVDIDLPLNPLQTLVKKSLTIDRLLDELAPYEASVRKLGAEVTSLASNEQE